VGTNATVTARYPGKLLAAKSPVAANTKPLQQSAGFTVAAAKGLSNPPACAEVSAAVLPQKGPVITTLQPAPVARDPFAAPTTPGRPVASPPATQPASPPPPVVASPAQSVPKAKGFSGTGVDGVATTSFIGHGEIGPAGGVVESTDRKLTLRFPAGALAAKTDIKIQNLSTDVDSPARGWRLSPEGMTFKLPVEMVISYSDKDVEGSVPEALEIGSRKTGGAWSMLDQFTLDAKAKTLTTKTTHFSDWSLLQGLQLRPEDPMVEIGKSVNLVVNSCIVVSTASELATLLGKCEPEKPALRTTDWSVNSTLGGNASLGMIDGRETGIGTYTAPKSKPNPSRVAVSTLYTSSSRKGLKALLVSNVTIIDVKGWRGWVKYNLSGDQASDETTLQGTVTTQIHIKNSVTGSGWIKFAPHMEAVPGSMIIVDGGGNLTRSSMMRIDATSTDPVCPQVKETLEDIREAGQAPNPANPLAVVLLTTSGNSYQLRLGSLSGRTVGPHGMEVGGWLVPGGTGTNCIAPVPGYELVRSDGDFPEHELLLEGTIDPSNPNVIGGQKTFYFGDLKGGHWVKVPGHIQVSWQFQK
jgi:hypothetical protein